MAVALAPAPAWAQVQSGTVTGIVQDQQDSVLPGVTVTLTGPDRRLQFVTTDDGRYRFLNVPPGNYTVTAALPGFATLVREHVQVVVGATVDLPFRMQVATVQENITVAGGAPILDARATGTSTNFTQDELSKIPTSRDPWALLRTVPGVQMDRVNIAGNETGQQSNFASKGSTRYDTVWTMDGVVITDMSATGGSPTYFDFDAFVADDLEMPEPFARRRVQGQQRIGEEVVAHAVRPVEVRGRRTGRDVDDAAALVGAMPGQLFAPPLTVQDSFDHVSCPNSPGCGMVWKIQRSFPVRTSYARMCPGEPGSPSLTRPPTISRSW
jgi:hypothetical protein